MKLRQFKALWGMIKATDGHLANSPHTTLETLLPHVKKLGYEGIEVPLKVAQWFGEDWKHLMNQHGLRSAFVLFTDGPVAPGGSVPGMSGHWLGDKIPGFSEPTPAGASDKVQIVEQHLTVWKEQVDAAAEYDPAYINSHSLKDYFTFGMAEDFFVKALSSVSGEYHEQMCKDGEDGDIDDIGTKFQDCEAHAVEFLIQAIVQGSMVKDEKPLIKDLFRDGKWYPAKKKKEPHTILSYE